MNSQQTQVSLGDILIVDDEPNNLRVLSTILSEQGYEPRGVLNGMMALKAASLAPPDLILLDIMMPQMSGYEVCQELKKNPKTRDIPVIFISAKDQVMDKVEAFAAGGVDYITKPFQLEEVLARLENHLQLHKLQQQLIQQNLLLQVEIRQRQAAEQALQEQNELLQKEICSRQRAEAALEKSNQELSRSNAELDKFASIASHDLRSPVTSIKCLAELFKMKYSESLDSKGNEYINRIINSCDRMTVLIEDLLHYSKTGKERKQLEPTDCQEVFEEACSNLDSEMARYSAAITCSKLPVVMGDRHQLVQLFQNLIDNAIKYRGEKTPAIHVSATLEKDCYLFSVKDNGIGIESQDFEKIFQIFQRLHGDSRYPGTGIGLAICQKIVERHHGRIWVESELGEGSTFYFTLPIC